MQNILQKIKEFKEKVFKKEHLETAKNFDYKGFVTTPSHSRTLAFLATVIIILALPVTMIVLNQQTHVLQFARYACPVDDWYQCAGANGYCQNINNKDWVHVFQNNSCGVSCVDQGQIVGKCGVTPPTPTPTPKLDNNYCNTHAGSQYSGAACTGTGTCRTEGGTMLGSKLCYPTGTLGTLTCCGFPKPPTPTPTPTPRPACGTGTGGKLFCAQHGICGSGNGLEPADSSDKGYGTCPSTEICCKELPPTPTEPKVVSCTSQVTFSDGNHGVCAGVGSKTNTACFGGNFYTKGPTDCPTGTICCDSSALYSPAVLSTGVVCGADHNGMCYDWGVVKSSEPIVCPAGMWASYQTKTNSNDGTACGDWKRPAGQTTTACCQPATPIVSDTIRCGPNKAGVCLWHYNIPPGPGNGAECTTDVTTSISKACWENDSAPLPSCGTVLPGTTEDTNGKNDCINDPNAYPVNQDTRCCIPNNLPTPTPTPPPGKACTAVGGYCDKFGAACKAGYDESYGALSCGKGTVCCAPQPACTEVAGYCSSYSQNNGACKSGYAQNSTFSGCGGNATCCIPTSNKGPLDCSSLSGKCIAAGNSCPSSYQVDNLGEKSCGSGNVCCIPTNRSSATPTPTPGGGGCTSNCGGGGGGNPTPTPQPKSYGACGGSGEGLCLASADPGDGRSYSYQTQTASSQCAINATNDNAPRGQTVYCCTTGGKQYGNCGNSGQYACTASCSGSNISYQDKAPDNQCAINGTKAGLARGTKMLCSVPASSVALSISLPAIGTGEFDNHSPKRTSRSFTVAVYAATADITKDKPLFTISHDSKFGSDGKFANPGHTLDKHQLLDGDFQLTITTGGYLTTQLLNSTGGKTIHLTEGKATQTAPVTLTPGDFNADNVIDIKDYNAFIGCYGSKAGTSSCVVGKDTADLNDDGNVDGIDYNLWLRSYLATLQQ